MKKILFALLIFIFCLWLGEQYFKRIYLPGYQTHYTGFTPVDSLIVYEDYQTDEFGNYVLSSLVCDTIKQVYDQKNCSFSDSIIIGRIASVDGITQILSDFCELKKKTSTASEFDAYYQKITAKTSWTKSDSAFIDYANYPFNKNGFKSLDFNNYPSEKIKVLLIGDSFVWGMSAKPYYNSFSDLLLARNYQVFSAGIPSVDPIQYLSICKNFVDSIHPDLVIINFYEGNDLIQNERVHSYNTPHEYITNAGFFEANPEGKHLGVEDAYNYYKTKLSIPSENWIDRILGKTAIGSLIWTKTHPNKIYQYKTSLNQEESIQYTKIQIEEMARFLEEKNYPYFFCITPNESESYNEGQDVISYNKSLVAELFSNIEHYIPSNLSHADYNKPKDMHFNNSGSLKYANFIDSLIQVKLHVE